jgi:hypothetical protein
MDRGLLVPYQDVFQLPGGIERVVDVEDCASGIAEDVLDAFFFKTADNDFRAGEFHIFFLINRHPPAGPNAARSSASRQASSTAPDVR